jgi:HK97 family phage major capsid protein
MATTARGFAPLPKKVRSAIGERFERLVSIEIEVGNETEDEEDSLEFSFSSEAPVERWFGKEILSHEEGCADLSRISDGVAPYLFNHNRDVVLGRVDMAWMDNKRGRCKVRWSPITKMEGTEEWKRRIEIESGTVRGVSFAYEIGDLKALPDDTYMVTKWPVLEISSVTIPADQTVGQGRSLQEETHAPEPEEIHSIPEESARSGSEPPTDIPMSQPAPPIEVQGPTADEARASERQRVEALISAGDRLEVPELARKLIAEGVSLEAAYPQLQEASPKLRKVEVAGVDHRADDAHIGLSEKEKGQYSFLKVARYLALRHEDPTVAREAAFELECSRAAEAKHARSSSGVLIPMDVLMQRSQVVDTLSAGGALVAAVRPESFIDLVRNRSAFLQSGVRMLSGLQGNVEIGKQTGASTYYFVGENTNVTNSGLSFGIVNMTPKTIGTRVPISRRMLIQSSPDIENLVRNDMASQVALGMDYSIGYGSGVLGQPLGIINTTGIGSVTLGGGVTVTFPSNLGGGTGDSGDWADYVGLETAISAQNLDVANMRYIMNSSMRGGLKTQLVASAAGSEFIYGRDNQINGYPVTMSNQMVQNDVLFGDFSQCLVGMWSGLDVTMDPYSQSASGQVILTALQDFDVAVRYAQAFALGT